MYEAVKDYAPPDRKAEVGNVENIKQQLEQLDEATIKKVEQRIESLPPTIQEIIGEEEKRYLASVYQKDEITFNHSLAVAEIARLQYGNFRQDLERLGISQESFFRSALFHDIGKLGLPDCILKGIMNEKDFERNFFVMKNSEPDFINQRLWERGLLSPGVNVRDLSDDKISEMKLDYRDFITLKQCFSGDETSLNEIRSYNIDPQATSFMDALRLHEQRSSEIIRGMNIKDAAVVAELAGSHHHYLKETDERFQPAKEVLRVSVAASELVHLADVYQAVRQRRPYSQKKYSHIEALHLIMQETKKGVFQPDIAKRWMSRALPNIDQVSKEDHQKYEELKQFLETKAVGVSSAI